MDEKFVFCYGSLMEGFGNHHCLRHAWFVGEGVTYPTFELLDLGAVPDEGGIRIGEAEDRVGGLETVEAEPIRAGFDANAHRLR